MKDISFLKKGVIAHRGVFNNKTVPENSIKAFSDAVKKGYTIELDIHLTKDNKLVVFHDDDLNRMTNKKGNINNYTLEELTNINLLDTEYKIPSFKEVLDLVKGKVGLLIELKNGRKNNTLVKVFLDEIEEYEGKYAVQSFNPFIISSIKSRNENIIRGLLLSNKKSLKHKLIRSNMIVNLAKPDFLSVNKYMYGYKVVENFKDGKMVLAWSINSKKELDEYKTKYDNIICNVKEII